MVSSSIIHEWDDASREAATQLCVDFVGHPPGLRFAFGCNVYTAALAEKLELAGVIDDFTTGKAFAGLPILKSSELPPDAMVVAASGGRPLTVRNLLRNRGIANIDYFTLQKWAGLDLPEAVFNEGFQDAFNANTNKVDWLFERLADEESRHTLRKLLSFRSSYNLNHLEGFTDRQAEQYFEPFFTLSTERPVFVDVGGFDGYTSAEFVRLCPDYHSVYIFEPEPENQVRCESRLAGNQNVKILPFGAGRETTTLRFSSNGSASAVKEDGEFEVQIRRIDDVISDAPSFIKIDIEGSELMALQGAKETISANKPVLAVAAYHRPSDMWDIPEYVLGINDEYKVYIRHYTESIYETVMYFVPPAYEAR